MTYKMYLMSISGFEQECLQEDAMCLLDSHRKELVHKYIKEKDRMRAIVAGLLLQVGFQEMEPVGAFCQTVKLQGGECYIFNGKEFVEYLKELAWKGKDKFPMELAYNKGNHGKPFWNRESLEEAGKNKKFWHFNLSHSGDYVVLVVADTEVGVDIQEPRKVKSFAGGFVEFSRMESFVKCTGAGYGHGVSAYKEHQGNVPGYEIQAFDLVDGYALHLCFMRCDV